MSNEALTSDSALFKFAQKIAKGFGRRFLANCIDDLTQAAAEGLLIARTKFDTTKGATFSSYGTLWARAYCQKALARSGVVSNCSASSFFPSKSASLENNYEDGDKDEVWVQGEALNDGTERADDYVARKEFVEHLRSTENGNVVMGRLHGNTLDEVGQMLEVPVSREAMRKREATYMTRTARRAAIQHAVSQASERVAV